MAADIHLGAVYYEDTTDGEDTSPDVIDITWTGGPAGGELKQLVINLDKNANGLLDPGEIFMDTAGANFGVKQFGNASLELVENGFTILSAQTLQGNQNWDGATSIILTFSGFNAGEHLLIKVDFDEQGFNNGASALVEGDEFQYSKMTATFAAPHYKNVTGSDVFLDDYSDAKANLVGLPIDNYFPPPALPVPLRTAGAFIDLIPEPLGSIRGNVHADYDGDCLVDPGEPLLQGVTIELLDAQGNVLRTTLTDVNGNYEFLDLDAGTYGVREIQPAGYFNGGTLPGTVNGATVGTTSTPNVIEGIQLASGQNGVEYNFCEKYGSISGRVHADANGDCVYQPGEVLIAGVKMELLDAGGNVVATTFTDAAGEYKFDRLLQGTYSVRETQPTLYFDDDEMVGTVGGATSGFVAADDLISGIQLVAARDGIRYDFCETYGSISGRVKDDRNGDCDTNPNVPGIAGVTIELLDAGGNVVRTTKTDADGRYSFDLLTRGTYAVREIQPKGWFDDDDHIGTINGVATGSHLANDVIGSIQLTSGKAGIDYDFCEVPAAELCGYVFQDGPTLLVFNQSVADALAARPGIYNGLLSGDDTRLAGVVLRLSRVDGQPIFDVDGNRVEFAVTDASGLFCFVGLPAGTYVVTEVQPGGYVDFLDTPGTTGGVAVGPDQIFGITLGWGQHSEFNNFSEVKVSPPPPLFFAPPPPPPIIPPVVPPPAAPAPLPAPAAAALPLDPPAPDYYDSGIVGYTWHLSVVNGGKPRTSRLTQSQLVAREREIAELEGERPDWDSETVRQGRFILRTGDDDQPSEREMEFGVARAIPVVGDFNGDGNTDVGVYRHGRWYIDLNGNGRWDQDDLWAKLGRRDDLPVTGDWDGDGKHDIAIFGRAWPGDPRHIAAEPGLPADENAKHGPTKNVPPQAAEATMGIRAMQLTSTGSMRSDLIDHVFLYGWGGDVPIAGDWIGEGQETIGIFRDGNWKLDVTGDGKYTDEDRAFSMGQAGDKPVIGDFNGDTVVDLGVYRNGLWHIDTNNDGVLDARDRAFTFGADDDLPVVGDWDGDGVDDPGLYRDKTGGAE